MVVSVLICVLRGQRVNQQGTSGIAGAEVKSRSRGKGRRHMPGGHDAGAEQITQARKPREVLSKPLSSIHNQRRTLLR